MAENKLAWVKVEETSLPEELVGARNFVTFKAEISGGSLYRSVLLNNAGSIGYFTTTFVPASSATSPNGGENSPDSASPEPEELKRPTAGAESSHPVKDNGRSDKKEKYMRCGMPEFSSLSSIESSRGRDFVTKFSNGNADPEQYVLDMLDDKRMDSMAYGILKDLGKAYGVHNIFRGLQPIPKPLIIEFLAVMHATGRLTKRL